MSTRPRIRSIKPEIWQDEKVGALSRDARLLLVGLITMCDDEGRLRALPSVILGHVFPWDEIAPRQLARLLAEIEHEGVILRYEDHGKPYVAFRHWRRHQQINKPRPSVLPAPPDPVVVRDNAVTDSGNATGEIPDPSGSGSGTPAGADRIGKGKDSPPSPPAGGEPPASLSGGRKRDQHRHQLDIAAFAAEHFPDVPAGYVQHYMADLRSKGIEPTVERLRPLVEQHRTSEAA